jgi:hypothetical protein
MPKTVTPFEVRTWLDENFRARAEFGLRKALAQCVLEAPNPFDPHARRKPRAGFLILGLLAAATITCFLYFNVAT